MPTTYPKCSVSELTGLLVLMDSHKGSDDVARLADDLDLEIDEILPSIDFSEALDFVKVDDGRASLTETGRKFLTGSIRERKLTVREQLKRTTLFRTLIRALDSAPHHRLSDEELARLVEFTTAPSDEVVQNIVNWGRYAELFRYDADEHQVVTMRKPAPPRTPPATKAPAEPSAPKAESAATTARRTSPPDAQTLPLALSPA
ncbi:MAG: AAA-associated domain-containing protein [Thermoplasmata archaeon]